MISKMAKKLSWFERRKRQRKNPYNLIKQKQFVWLPTKKGSRKRPLLPYFWRWELAGKKLTRPIRKQHRRSWADRERAELRKSIGWNNLRP